MSKRLLNAAYDAANEASERLADAQFEAGKESTVEQLAQIQKLDEAADAAWSLYHIRLFSFNQH